MDSTASSSLLCLTGLLLFGWCCEGAPTSYTIDTVALTVQPAQTVESGTPVTLRCAVSVSHDPSLHLTHIFQFVRNDVTVHSVNTTDTEVSYRFSPARAADSGAYECHVKVKEKMKLSRAQELTVTGLQTPHLQLSTGQLYEGEELTATCSAPEEKGPLLFSFYKESQNGEAQLIKQVMPAGSVTETKLLLRDMGDRLLFCNYSIPVLPEAGRSNRSNKVQVIVKGLFISPVMNVLPSSDVFEGDDIEVVCKVVSPPGNVDVYLTKDRSVLRKAAVAFNHRFTVRAEDSGQYVCKAEWGATQKENYVTIRVKELFSKPQLKTEPAELFEGERLKLTCSIDSYSPERITNEDVRFSIYKNGVELTRGEAYNVVAKASDNGNYTCKAQVDARGKAFVKESATVVVEAKISVSEPTLSVEGDRMVVGKPFTLRCHSESGSLPIKYTLRGPNNRPPQIRVVNRPGEQAVFNTSAVQKSADLLKFLCQASNNNFRPAEKSSVQKLLNTIEIIEPLSRPVLTMFPNEEAVAEGQDLTLYCAVQKGTLPVTFTWYHTERRHPLALQIPQGMKGSYTIKGVRGDHAGGYYCEGNNQANDTKRSFTVMVGVKMAGWKKGLIAVFCILLTMTIILAVIFKKGLLPLRRKRIKDLSVKSASTKPERLSLTQAEDNEVVNVTPGVMGRSVWSEHVSGSDTDEQNSVASPEEPETQYAEVRTRQPDPSRGPVKKGTDTVYSQVRNSKQGAPEPADGQGSLEYAQLNNDIGQHNKYNSQDIQQDNIDDLDDIENSETAAHEERNQDPQTPGC